MLTDNSSNTHPPGAFLSAKYRVKQLKIVLRIILAALVVLLVTDIALFPVSTTEAALGLSIAILCFLYYFVSQDTTNIIAGMLLWGLTVLVLYLSWSNLGLFDVTILAYPCILMLAIILGGRLLFIPLFLFVLASFILFAFGYGIGLIDNRELFDTFYWARALNLSIILVFFTLTTAYYSRDIKKLIQKIAKENIELEQNIKETVRLGNYDPLTKLPNERVCSEDLQKLVATSSRQDKKLAFITLDIQNLRSVNSSLGHSIGDALLEQLTQRLVSLSDQTNHLYRFQGNEFVLLRLAQDHEEISNFSEQILQATTLPFHIQDFEIEVASAIGIAVAPFDGDTLEPLRKKSHLALYSSKQRKSNGYYFFDEEMATVEQDRYQLTKALREALLKDEFELYYQPKVELTTNRIIGAEALIRWHRPGHGMVPPDVFIGVAEESGLISELGKWVANQACKTCKEWHQQGLTELTVAINLSATQFKKGNLPQVIFKALNSVDLPPHYLELEITESILVDDASQIQSQIQSLHARGIMIAIDDFGTGYSNLGYLSKFNVTTLKIDQSFIRKITDSIHDFHIIKAIIQMSESLTISNVAEGIEDIQTMEKVKALGCQFGQGYYWSKPLPNTEFIQLVKDSYARGC